MVQYGLILFTGLISLYTITNEKIFNNIFSFLNIPSFHKWIFALFVIFAIAEILFFDINRDYHIIRKGSGTYIDCGSQYKNTGDCNFPNLHTEIGETISPIEFSSKDKFISFFSNKTFTNEQIENISQISCDGKIELPDIEKIHCISFDGGENILGIEWYGGNDYVHNMSGIYKNKSFKFSAHLVVNPETVEFFRSRKKQNSKTIIKRNVYKKDDIRYIEYIGNTIPYSQLYWSFTNSKITYDVYQSSSNKCVDVEYEFIEILISDKDEYQILSFKNLNSINVTPDFVKKFKTYVYSIDVK